MRESLAEAYIFSKSCHLSRKEYSDKKDVASQQKKQLIIRVSAQIISQKENFCMPLVMTIKSN
jgi:hypothetical protein